MKSVLSIILWVFAPMLTPYGLQIGEIKTNNQTIKVMKKFILSPEWLQAASNIGGGEPIIRMILTEGSDGKVQLSANGLVIVEYVQDGEIVRNTYSALSDTYVTIPVGVEATVYGEVTAIGNDERENIFSSLDLSKSTSLTRLYCYGCTDLTSLDLSKCTSLTYLNCGGCGLTSLDVSKNTELTSLSCDNCTDLTSLDLGKNTVLTDFMCNDCPILTSLDLSKCTSLNVLNCYGCTGLTSLDLSKSIDLTELYCHDCTDLTLLDVSKNTELTSLSCYGCTGLTSLDVSKNTALIYLDCHDCTDLTLLDVSKNTELTSLYCNDCTSMMLLNIQNTTQLKTGNLFSGIDNNLTTLQVAETSEWACEQVVIWLNGDAPSGGTILVDENTPQDVITAATGKSWTVEYVDAA